MTGMVQQFQHAREDSASLSDDKITCLWLSRADTLWVGTLAGLNRFERATQTFTRFKHEPQNPNSLSQNAIWCLQEDHAGNIWIGTERSGLNKFEPASRRFVRYTSDPANPNSLSHNSVSALYADRRGVLWVGTDNGLNQFDPRTNRFTRYSEAEGLRGGILSGILGDESGRLWLSTNRGVVRFSPQLPAGQQFRNYDVKDGLQALTFLEGSAYQSSAGEMFFGGDEGLNRFHPLRVRDNPHPPAIVVTSFKIFDKPVPLDTTISARSTLTLSYEDNFFSFEFDALDFTHPEKNQYAYKMEGFDADWIHSGTRRYASYTNLDHGEYRLRVKGSNNDGVWNEAGAAIRIAITPPFWETWWFRGLALAAMALGLVWLYRHRVARLLEVERLRVRIASDLHDDIGATLTKISLHAELIEESQEPNEVRDSLRKIGAMSRELVTTMSDVVWSIDARNDTVGNLLDRMREFAASVLAAKSATFTFSASGLDLQKQLSVTLRQNVYLIFKEAINNIAKHAAEASHVDINLKNAEGNFNLIVRDDGKNSKSGEKLTGQGLRNMKMRAARIGGRLDFSCENGCIVSLTAPAFK